MFKQVKFIITSPSFDDVGNILGGIAHYNENDIIDYVICACCGGTFKPDEISILKEYNYWADLTLPIIDE